MLSVEEYIILSLFLCMPPIHFYGNFICTLLVGNDLVQIGKQVIIWTSDGIGQRWIWIHRLPNWEELSLHFMTQHIQLKLVLETDVNIWIFLWICIQYARNGWIQEDLHWKQICHNFSFVITGGTEVVPGVMTTLSFQHNYNGEKLNYLRLFSRSLEFPRPTKQRLPGKMTDHKQCSQDVTQNCHKKWIPMMTAHATVLVQN